jgi:hypothetical protein
MARPGVERGSRERSLCKCKAVTNAEMLYALSKSHCVLRVCLVPLEGIHGRPEA